MQKEAVFVVVGLIARRVLVALPVRVGGAP